MVHKTEMPTGDVFESVISLKETKMQNAEIASWNWTVLAASEQATLYFFCRYYADTTAECFGTAILLDAKQGEYGVTDYGSSSLPPRAV